MARTLLCCAALAACSLPARAEQTVTSTELLVRLTVRPAAAPRPALKYLLLPELKEMTPGNPIPNYLKCTLDQDFSSLQESISPAALRLADRAARMDKPDWQILLKVKTDGISLLIPDVQKLRAVAAALQERFREENGQRRVGDALETAKTLFALSRHMGEHPTLIGGLVGIAIANVAIAPLEEMLEQPGCPNLYWALTDLPSPLVSLGKGMEGERVLIQAEFRDLDDRAPMSAGQIKKLVAHLDKLRSSETDNKTGVRPYLDARVKDPAALRAARGRLAESGLPEERLARFPADQVILLDERLTFEARRDDGMKYMKLPTPQFEKMADKFKPPIKEDEGLFGFLGPQIIKIRRAQGRLEQRVALLQHVEAVRMYAAAHGGKLPAKLADCGLPLPDDPFTGRPFRYEADGDTFHLRGTPPKGEEKVPTYNVHYHVTVRK